MPSGGVWSGTEPLGFLVVGAGEGERPGRKMKNPPAGRCGGRANAMFRRSPYVRRSRPVRVIGLDVTPNATVEQRGSSTRTARADRHAYGPPGFRPLGSAARYR